MEESVWNCFPWYSGFAEKTNKIADASNVCDVAQVPVGTLVKTTEGTELKDLRKAGDVFVAARGGAGNFHLSKKSPLTLEFPASVWGFPNTPIIHRTM